MSRAILLGLTKAAQSGRVCLLLWSEVMNAAVRPMTPRGLMPRPRDLGMTPEQVECLRSRDVLEVGEIHLMDKSVSRPTHPEDRVVSFVKPTGASISPEAFTSLVGPRVYGDMRRLFAGVESDKKGNLSVPAGQMQTQSAGYIRGTARMIGRQYMEVKDCRQGVFILRICDPWLIKAYWNREFEVGHVFHSVWVGVVLVGGLHNPHTNGRCFGVVGHLFVPVRPVEEKDPDTPF